MPSLVVQVVTKKAVAFCMIYFPWCSGLGVLGHNTGDVSMNHTRVTIKTPLVRKATGNHLIKSTSLEKAQSPVSGFCYPRNPVCDTVYNLDLLQTSHSSGNFL